MLVLISILVFLILCAVAPDLVAGLFMLALCGAGIAVAFTALLLIFG
jgi:hypothetical protein